MAYIGIDLGTTNTVLAVVNPRTKRTEILEIGDTIKDIPIEERKLIPSVISSQNGQYFRGWYALTYAQVDPKNTIFSIKRLMGRGYNDKQEYGAGRNRGKLIRELMHHNWPFEIVKPSGATDDAIAVLLEERQHSPQDISRYILLEAKSVAEAYLGENVEGAVITVPAYFNEKQCAATVEAAKMAGITVQQILDEPTAAAKAYARDTLSLTPRTVLVYDLGGGTFDVSLLEIVGPNISVETIDGDNWLGGDDFTREIVNDLVEVIRKKTGQDPRENVDVMFILRMKVEKAKIELTAKNKIEIPTGDLFPAVPSVTIVRDKKDLEDPLRQNVGSIIIPRAYNEMIIDYVEETIELINKVLKRKNYEYEDIDKVLLIGGTTKIPLIREKLAEMFGEEKLEISKVDPMLAVAIGAAYVAESLALKESIICPWHLPDGTLCHTENKIGSKICINMKCGKPLPIPESGSLTERPYGIEVYNSETKRNEFDVIIPKDEKYPLKEPAQVIRYIGKSGRRVFKVRFFAGKKWEGGEFHPEVDKNEYQGTVWMLLPPNTPPGAEVIIKFNLNKNKVMVDISIQCEGLEVKKEMISRGERDETLGKKIEEVMEKNQNLLNQRIIKEDKAQQLMKDTISAMTLLIDSYHTPGEQNKTQFLDDAEKRVEIIKNELTPEIKKSVDPFIFAKGMRNYGYFVLKNYHWLPFLQDESRKKETMDILRDLEQAIKRGEKAVHDNDEETINRELDETMFLTLKLSAFLAHRTLDMFESIRISILAARGELKITGGEGEVAAGPWKTRPESYHIAGTNEGLQDARTMQEGLNKTTVLLKSGRVEEAEKAYREIEPLVFKWIIKGGYGHDI
jgi:molecular chaperone DnaK (HSP70)